MDESTLTASDVALLGKNDTSEWGGGSFMWIFALLILLFGFGGGNFGWGNNGSALSQADLQRAIDLNSIQEGQAAINANIQRDIYETTAAVKDASYNNLGELRDVQAAVATGDANIINNLTSLATTIQTGTCATQRAIDSVNYNLASQSAAIQANDTANTQKVLDAIAANRMADMQSQINALQLQNAVAGVVRYPMASTYSSGTNPFCSCNCNCGNI